MRTAREKPIFGSNGDPEETSFRISGATLLRRRVPEQGHTIHMPADSQEDDEYRRDGRQHANGVVGARGLEPRKPGRGEQVETSPYDSERGQRDGGVEAGEVDQEIPAGVDAAVA